ncbi:MAG: class I SAM-dependent methyltransferase [Candidatus Adiutrix sp.]|nr:class I SAM-dependent methyltransferase [Candidatus Adiutrix sp.]
MFLLKEALKKKPSSEQLKSNAARLPDLKRLLKGRSFAEVRDDYDVLARLNELMGGFTESWPKADPAAMVESAKGELRFAVEVKKVELFKSFCDVGCGSGYFARAAFEMGCDFSCGLDIQPHPAWESFLEGADGRLKYLTTDISAARHERKYEMVTSFSAFEHFKNPPLMLKAMSELAADGGYLYLNFSPIYNAADGLHMAPLIRIPWHHLIFSRQALARYYKDFGLEASLQWAEEWLNKWSAVDFMNMFSNFNEMRLISLQPFWNLNYYWFARLFPDILPPWIGLEELLINGFRVVYKKERPF